MADHTGYRWIDHEGERLPTGDDASEGPAEEVDQESPTQPAN